MSTNLPAILRVILHSVCLRSRHSRGCCHTDCGERSFSCSDDLSCLQAGTDSSDKRCCLGNEAAKCGGLYIGSCCCCLCSCSSGCLRFCDGARFDFALLLRWKCKCSSDCLSAGDKYCLHGCGCKDYWGCCNASENVLVS
jgi:hypothetical protein